MRRDRLEKRAHRATAECPFGRLGVARICHRLSTASFRFTSGFRRLSGVSALERTLCDAGQESNARFLSPWIGAWRRRARRRRNPRSARPRQVGENSIGNTGARLEGYPSPHLEEHRQGSRRRRRGRRSIRYWRCFPRSPRSLRSTVCSPTRRPSPLTSTASPDWSPAERSK